MIRRASITLLFLGAALAITLTAATLLFGIPLSELPAIRDLLLGVGSVGSMLALGMMHPSVLRRIGGVRGQLVTAGLITALLLLGMVLAGAWIMFFSVHDLALLLTMLLFAALLALGFNVLWATPLAQRIARVRAGTQSVAQGVLDTTLPVDGNDEIALLATDFNRMAQTLVQARQHEHDLEQARRDLVAAVSHDLRTPIAASRAMLEALVDGVADEPEIQIRYLVAVHHEITHLSQLVDDLFELAQLDAGALQLTLERASLHDLLSDTLAAFGPQAQQQGVQLVGEVQGEIDPVLINPPKLQRVLHNLLINALHHTPADGTIMLRAAACGPLVEVEVSDTGEGIAPSDLPHVFDRSFRSERSRTRRGGDTAAGAGLGLAIARGLVEAHGGTINVHSQLEQGASFRFTLRRVE